MQVEYKDSIVKNFNLLSSLFIYYLKALVYLATDLFIKHHFGLVFLILYTLPYSFNIFFIIR